MGYVSTFISATDGGPAQVPPTSRNGPSVASVQHELLTAQPHALTQEDLLFETEVRRRWTPQQLEPRRDELRAAFSERRRSDLRSSPLVMTYGWGLLFDEHGRIALVARGTREYERLESGQVDGIRVLRPLGARRSH
jgi:hypothetical protein